MTPNIVLTINGVTINSTAIPMVVRPTLLSLDIGLIDGIDNYLSLDVTFTEGEAIHFQGTILVGTLVSTVNLADQDGNPYLDSATVVQGPQSYQH
jgi:hypothetical protein